MTCLKMSTSRCARNHGRHQTRHKTLGLEQIRWITKHFWRRSFWPSPRSSRQPDMQVSVVYLQSISRVEGTHFELFECNYIIN